MRLLLLLLLLLPLQAFSQCSWTYNPFTKKMDCSSPAVASGDVTGPSSNTHGNIPKWNGTDSKTLDDGLGVSTSIATPGVDTKVPTEKAVRDALSVAAATTPFNLVGTADERHFSIKRFTGQTAPIFCIVDENDNNLFCFDKDGSPTVYGSGGGTLELDGSTSGTVSVTVPAVAGTNTITFPAATGTVALESANAKIGAFGCSWGEPGGTTLSSGLKCYTDVVASGTITGWRVKTDTGTATVDVWKIASGTANPTVSNALTGSGATHPEVSSGEVSTSTNLTNWSSTTVTAQDIAGFNLDSVAGASFVQVTIFYAKN